MTNIASILKEEISRVARKAVRGETQSLKMRVSACRTEITSLKRRTALLEVELRRVHKAHAKSVPSDEPAQPENNPRFSAKGLGSQRRRLGLSALECGLLVGATGQSIYNWEQGAARPRVKHLPALAALRTMGKKAAAARLASLR
jgi:DNA-binding transcriptional regulator YiaG